MNKNQESQSAFKLWKKLAEPAHSPYVYLERPQIAVFRWP